ncbi:hypothetical protein [Novosphingobium sp.]|uniref:hypothetical protein n=1 Tax=Novosphingobium sp. TaxID=1874826 RepID=UPI002FE11CF0
MKVQIIPCKLDGPVETGPVQIGEDLPGLFIRGIEAGVLAEALRGVMRHSNAQRYHMSPVNDLLRHLQACSPQTGYRY